MKNISIVLVAFCAIFHSCDSLDLSKVGYGDGDRLKASEVKEVLYTASGGYWKADYEGREFFFRFLEDGTVTVDSDYLEVAETVETAFSSKGKAVQLVIEGGGHFGYLGTSYSEDTFIISELPASSGGNIIMKGEGTGNSIVLQPSTKAYIDSRVDLKSDFIEMLQKNMLDNGVVCDGDLLVAYYSLELDHLTSEYYITVITIEDKTGSAPKGYTQYYRSAMTKSGQRFILNTPVTDIKATNGNTYSFNALNCETVLAIDGMSGLTITSNRNAVPEFDYAAGQKWSMNYTQRLGDASIEIWESTYDNGTYIGDPALDFWLVGIDALDPGMNSSAATRPLIFWTWGLKISYWPSSLEGADIMYNKTEKDRILFRMMRPDGVQFTGNNSTAHNAAEIAAIKSHFWALFETWFNEEGLYLAKKTESDGNRYTYMLCPDTTQTSGGGMWIKWKAS